MPRGAWWLLGRALAWPPVSLSTGFDVVNSAVLAGREARMEGGRQAGRRAQ